MKDELTRRTDALWRRGLLWQLSADLHERNDPALLAKVEALSDEELASLTRLPVAGGNDD